MKLLAISDIHGDIRAIQRLVRIVNDCDAVVITGDITDFGGAEQANAVLSELAVLQIPVLAVTGNCDSSPVEKAMTQNHCNVANVPIQLNGFTFIGFKYPVPDNQVLPNESIFLNTPQIPIVLLTHEPPWDTDVDLQASTRHRGSRAVRSWIEQHQPILAVSGHIHEAYGIDRIGSTVLVNPGPLRNGQYAIIELQGSTVIPRLLWL